MSVNIDKEFEELRKDFLYHAEDLTLKLNSIISNQDLDKETFKEVFRIVHSLKGGAASHEFTNLSTICHHFEDFLTLKLVDDLQNNEHYETCLKFTDILEEVIKKKIKGEEILFSKYIEQISYLNLPEAETSQGFKGQILVVDNTKTIGSIVKKSLEDTGYACTLTKNGLVAFNKLVTKKFDALISSINLSPFDGISLVTALRSTNNINADIPTLVISASKNIVERFPKDYRPNKVVVKDEQFIENLNHSLEDLFSAQSNDLTVGPKNILYVEDDPKMQKLMQLSLKKYGEVKLNFAEDKKTALNIIENKVPDIVLLDNFLKNTSGYEVYQAIKEFKVPVIFLTASGSSVPVEKLKNEKEFLGIITKPFRPGAIYGQIKRFYSDRK
ncbi:MAG: hypothetical protein CME69_04585 [Halobacteriovorax sp.]|nr:hypothetical protein [Halobacteriovorax sp.]